MNTKNNIDFVKQVLISVGCQLEASRILLINIQDGEPIDDREAKLVRDGLVYAQDQITASLKRWEAGLSGLRPLLAVLESNESWHSEDVVGGIDALRSLVGKS